MIRSDRGMSAALGYILTLSITTILISGLFITAGSVVDTQRQQATTQELTVHGERLAADLMTVDRLARTGSAVELERDLPVSVGEQRTKLRSQARRSNSEVTMSRTQYWYRSRRITT